MRITLLILFLFTVLEVSSQERAFTVWNQNDVTASLREKVSVKVAEKVYYSPESNAIDTKYGEVVVGYQLKNWLKSGIAFRHLSKYSDKWYTENRPMAFIDLSTHLKNFSLSFSNRIEYRTFKEFENHYRHRQALNLSFPRITDWGMQFYMYEESFCKLNGAGTHLARVVTGIKALDKQHFDIKLYYGLEKLKGSETWLTTDIVGLNLSFAI